MRIIPAIDIIEGKCVRLTEGDYRRKKVYRENPVAFAQELEDHGIRYLHLVDLDGAKSKHIVNYKILEAIRLKTNLEIDFGGGLKSNQDVKIAFESGADKITGGSVAVRDPDLFLNWLAIYGQEKIILGADCKNRKIQTNGWMESSTLDILDFIKSYEQKGIQQVICTDISKDGCLEGPAQELYTEVLQKSRVQLIASGGVTTMQDLLQLRAIGCEAAIVGKAIYEGKITLKEIGKLC